MTTPFYPNHPKRQIVFFIFFQLLLAWVTIKSVAQDSTKNVEKQIAFGDESPKKTATIKKGDVVEIQLKNPGRRIVGTVLSFTDPSILIAFEDKPYQLFIPLWNIAELTVLDTSQKLYKVKIVLTNHGIVKGLVRLGDSDVELISKKKNESQHSTKIAIADVNTINIGGKKKWFAIGIGAGIGFALGGIIAASVYKPNPNDWLGIDTAFGELGSIAEGALIGVVVGGGIGLAAAGESPQKFKINGDPANYKKMKDQLKKNTVTAIGDPRNSANAQRD